MGALTGGMVSWLQLVLAHVDCLHAYDWEQALTPPQGFEDLGRDLALFVKRLGHIMLQKAALRENLRFLASGTPPPNPPGTSVGQRGLTGWRICLASSARA